MTIELILGLFIATAVLIAGSGLSQYLIESIRHKNKIEQRLLKGYLSTFPSRQEIKTMLDSIDETYKEDI